MDVALTLAGELAQGALFAQSTILGLLNAPSGKAFEQHLEVEKRHMAVALGSPEAAEGIAAFKQKRAPKFPPPPSASAHEQVKAAVSANVADPNQAQILIRREGAVLQLTMSSPQKKNAISQAMYLSLAAALNDAAEDPQIHVVVIQGAGGVFTSGNDVNDFSPRSEGQKPPSLIFLESIVSFPKPLVAKVEGLAIGVGCTMLLHCDLVYAHEDTRFRLPFVNLGLVPEAASSYLIPRMMGHVAAAELLLLGDMFSASVAKEAGLISAVGSSDTINRRVDEVAAQLAAKPPGALQQTKALMRNPNTDGLIQRVHMESQIFGACVVGPEFAEASAALREKRAPDFSMIKSKHGGR